MTQLVTAFVERYPDGSLETVALVSADAGGGTARIVPVHPNGEEAVRIGLYDPSPAEMEDGVRFVRWFSDQFGRGSASFATPPKLVRSESEVELYRLAPGGAAFTPASRAVLLAQLADRPDDPGDQLRFEYLRRVPYVPIARCPFTDAALLHTLDIYGLDGPWWGAHALSCDVAEPVPDSYLVMSGGFFDLSPPAAVRRLAEMAHVQMVVRELTVAGKAAWVVVYFSLEPDEVSVPWTNRWGACDYLRRSLRQLDERRNDGLAPDDADLARWMADGRLHWIATGDPALRLRTGATGCPFVR